MESLKGAWHSCSFEQEADSSLSTVFYESTVEHTRERPTEGNWNAVPFQITNKTFCKMGYNVATLKKGKEQGRDVEAQEHKLITIPT